MAKTKHDELLGAIRALDVNAIADALAKEIDLHERAAVETGDGTLRAVNPRVIGSSRFAIVHEGDRAVATMTLDLMPDFDEIRKDGLGEPTPRSTIVTVELLDGKAQPIRPLSHTPSDHDAPPAEGQGPGLILVDNAPAPITFPVPRVEPPPRASSDPTPPAPAPAAAPAPEPAPEAVKPLDDVETVTPPPGGDGGG